MALHRPGDMPLTKLVMTYYDANMQRFNENFWISDMISLNMSIGV